MLEQFSNFGLQSETIFVPQIGEPKRLQVALCGPHGKQHRRFPPHPALAHVHGQVDRDSLIEAGGHFEQTPSNRNPMHFGPELSPVFKLNGCGSASPQVDARGADFSSRVGEVAHYDFNYVTPRRYRAHYESRVRKAKFTRWNPYSIFRNLPFRVSA